MQRIWCNYVAAKHIDWFYCYCSAKKRPFQVSEKHNNGLGGYSGPLFPLRTSSQCIRPPINQWTLLSVFDFRPYCLHQTYKRGSAQCAPEASDFLNRLCCARISYCLHTGNLFLIYKLNYFITLSKCNSVFLFLYADMSGKVTVVFALLVVLLVSSAASSPVEGKDTNVLRQLLAKREKVNELGVRQEPAPWADPARMERRAHLSEDEREIMTKQVMQAISGMLLVWMWKCFVFDVSVRWMGRDPERCSDVFVCGSCRNGLFTEMMNSECMSNRDYQGWVDFGRRDTEWDASDNLRAHTWCFLRRFYRKLMFYSSCNFINKLICRIITVCSFITVMR